MSSSTDLFYLLFYTFTSLLIIVSIALILYEADLFSR